MLFKRLIALLITSAIVLSGCADRFSGMSTPASECGYRQVHFDEFASCMRTKLNPENLGAGKSVDQYDIGKSAQTDVLDDIRGEFITGLDDIVDKYQGKKRSRGARDKAAYDAFDRLKETCAAKEEAANKQAQTFAAILLAGAAIGGAAAYCSNHNCGGGGGQSYSNHQGCCSWHGGIGMGCGIHGHLMCADGQESPSCPCF